jgi:G3E family GTPase
LAEQVETADVILINKKDLAGPEQVKIASSLAKSLNKDAEMEEVEYGRVTPKTILRQVPNEILKKESSCCSKPDCTDSSHSHNPEHSSDSAEPDCTDSNDHSRSSMSTDDLGIVNFVYKANRPFNTKKLLALLNQWPVPIKDDLDISLLQEAQEDGYLTAEGIQQDASPFVGILRSKGFCWFAPTRWEGNEEDVWRHDTAMYWSHAGKHFGISSAGKWWGSVTQEQMKKHLEDNLEEYERILKEDFVTEEFGDRRQEIVFIGVSLDEEKITSSLDECLLTDKGLKRYRRELKRFIDTVQSDPFS